MAVFYILAMVALFSASIFVHELGHFLAARAFGMVADVFSIGMGRAVWKRRIGETTWQIGWLPFGGYVALPQMDPNSFLEGTSSEVRGQRSGGAGQGPEVGGRKSAGAGPEPRTPNPEPRVLPPVAAWKKMLVAVAGAAGNVVFAFVLATVVWRVGKPSALQERSGVIGYVAADSAAAAAGLAAGDEIRAVNGQAVASWPRIVERAALSPSRDVALQVRTRAGAEREVTLRTEKTPLGLYMLPGLAGPEPCAIAEVEAESAAAAAGLRAGDRLLRHGGQEIFSQPHLIQLVEAAGDRPVAVEFRRGDEVQAVTVAARFDAALGRHRLGIRFNTMDDLDYAVLVHPTPWAQVREHASGIFRFLDALTTKSTAGAAAGAVGGPVMILRMLYLMVEASFILAIWFTGFLNVNLAIINLLPLPILDGGHVVINAWELVFRRPAPPRLVNALANVFVVLFIGLFLLLVFRDSLRLLGK